MHGRGHIIGLLKAMLGLGPSLAASAYHALLAPHAARLLLALAAAPTVIVGAGAGAGARVHAGNAGVMPLTQRSA